MDDVKGEEVEDERESEKKVDLKGREDDRVLQG